MKKALPIVAIVGRMNVGKSTLFNRLSESARSITYDYAGVTRDIITDTVSWKDRTFQLVDTGGIAIKKITEDFIAEEVRTRAIAAVHDADVVIFVCDGTIGILPEDRSLARWLHKEGKKAILAINKIDTKDAKEHQHEFLRLGFERMVPISAQHSIGIADLFDDILALLPEPQEIPPQEKPRCKLVILGKPNVGKSSLLNLLLKKDRAIVADMPGTTREAITEQMQFATETIQLTDTPGIRRKRGVTEPIEKLMVKSALASLEDADVVLLMMDASEGRIVDQELKLAFYIFEERYKGLIILYNKEDLVTEQMKEDLEFSLDEYRYFLDKVEEIRTSVLTKKNIGRLLKKIDSVCTRYNKQFTGEELFHLFKEALEAKPLYRSQQRLIVYHAEQIKTAPITIALTVGEPKWFGPSQLGFFERILRQYSDLKGVPIKFVLRKKRPNN
ncbi:MAG TPA: ribosome biogenesis GTPase Der [Candidatus Babeliales bacterium]|nr:ribosome biogenesis GTPase Der [Candidatus Babeliales bacterium]